MMLSENTKEAPDGYTLLTFGTSYGLLDILSEQIKYMSNKLNK